MKRLVTIVVMILATVASIDAQEPAAASITARINASGNITVTHPSALELRLINAPRTAVTPAEENSDSIAATPIQTQRVGGYRVQVFSDNNHKTAKAEAQTKAHAIAGAFPQYPTYVMYTSPYWRLRVGDFRSEEEAENVANEIKRAFPSYAREIRVVKDRINVSVY